MTIKDGVKFGIGFVIGKALVNGLAMALDKCMKEYKDQVREIYGRPKQNEDVEVE